MMTFEDRLLSPGEEDEKTVDNNKAAYRPEGNEAGVLSEYLFELRWDSPCEGLDFPAEPVEEESTYVPEHHPHP